jgi:hypothetical protein
MQKKICISPSGLGAERQVCIVVALSGVEQSVVLFPRFKTADNRIARMG